MTDSGRRLTSWKEIASYFGRDVRTVMRWEKERALPVHRGPGGKSGVVFADTQELEAWTRGVAPGPALPVEPSVVPAPALTHAKRSSSLRAWIAVAVIAALGLVGATAWQLRGTAADASASGPSGVVLTATAVVARNADGSTRWRYDFPGKTISPAFGRNTNPIDSLEDGSVLVGVSDIVRGQDAAIGSGQLLLLDAAGRMQRSFSFDDRLSIGAREFLPPWGVADYQVRRGATPRHIAVSGHHYEWWPSIVTVLDADWHRRGSFINAGWVEHLRWISDTRLAIAGFSNEKDGGMVALLDVNAMNGQSPFTPGSRFACTACGADSPVRYVVMPRSEVNRLSAAPFNRASISVRSGALLVRTVEMPQTPGTAPADAEYEFTFDLELVRATYTDRYWEAHKELERRGKIAHGRAHCPERDGPRQIEAWDPAHGWRTQALAPFDARRIKASGERPPTS